jgi:hypothetical protein
MKPDNISPVLSKMSHANAMKHIADMLPGANASFTEECISALNVKTSDNLIQSITVTYDKIRIQLEDKVFFWPIVPYTEEMKKDFVVEFLKKTNQKII